MNCNREGYNINRDDNEGLREIREIVRASNKEINKMLKAKKENLDFDKELSQLYNMEILESKKTNEEKQINNLTGSVENITVPFNNTKYHIFFSIGDGY